VTTYTNFIEADFSRVTEAADGEVSAMPDDFRISITSAPGSQTYPISSFTWMLFPYVIGDSAERETIIAFIRWGLTDRQDILESPYYSRLPSPVIAKEEKAIDRIKASGDGGIASSRPTAEAKFDDFKIQA
jgi:phosphate transport system substrate-binding protein